MAKKTTQQLTKLEEIKNEALSILKSIESDEYQSELFTQLLAKASNRCNTIKSILNNGVDEFTLTRAFNSVYDVQSNLSILNGILFDLTPLIVSNESTFNSHINLMKNSGLGIGLQYLNSNNLIKSQIKYITEYIDEKLALITNSDISYYSYNDEDDEDERVSINDFIFDIYEIIKNDYLNNDIKILKLIEILTTLDLASSKHIIFSDYRIDDMYHAEYYTSMMSYILSLYNDDANIYKNLMKLYALEIKDNHLSRGNNIFINRYPASMFDKNITDILLSKTNSSNIICELIYDNIFYMTCTLSIELKLNDRGSQSFISFYDQDINKAEESKLTTNDMKVEECLVETINKLYIESSYDYFPTGYNMCSRIELVLSEVLRSLDSSIYDVNKINNELKFKQSLSNILIPITYMTNIRRIQTDKKNNFIPVVPIENILNIANIYDFISVQLPVSNVVKQLTDYCAYLFIKTNMHSDANIISDGMKSLGITKFVKLMNSLIYRGSVYKKIDTLLNYINPDFDNYFKFICNNLGQTMYYNHYDVITSLCKIFKESCSMECAMLIQESILEKIEMIDAVNDEQITPYGFGGRLSLLYQKINKLDSFYINELYCDRKSNDAFKYRLKKNL